MPILVIQSSAAPESTNEVKFRATCLSSWNGPDLYLLSTDNTYLAFTVHSMAYTKTHTHQRNEPITIFQKSTAEDSKESHTPLLKVTIPNTIREPLIALHWDDTSMECTSTVLEFSPEKFPYGSYQIVNLSDIEIEGYIGTEENKISCAAKQQSILNFQFEPGSRIAIVFQHKINDQIKNVFSSLAFHRQRKRVILFFTSKATKNGRINYSTRPLVDYKPEPNKAP